MAYEHPIVRIANLRRLYYYIKSSPKYKYVSWKLNHFSVQFANGLREKWFIKRCLESKDDLMIPFDPFKGGDVSVTHQYEYTLLDKPELAHMRMIDYGKWSKASFIRKREVINEYIDELIKDGQIPLNFTQDELVGELSKLWKKKVSSHIRNGNLFLFSSSIGKKLMLQFADCKCEETAERLFRPRTMRKSICAALNKGKDANKYNVYMGHSKYSKYMSGYHNASIYRAIFKLLRIKNMAIADPHPDFGSKAIASMMEENYYHGNNDLSKLSTFLGTEFNKLDKEHYDVVMLDYSFRKNDNVFNDLKYWASKADYKIVFVSKDYFEKLPPSKYQLQVMMFKMEVKKFISIGHLYIYV